MDVITGFDELGIFTLSSTVVSTVFGSGPVSINVMCQPYFVLGKTIETPIPGGAEANYECYDVQRRGVLVSANWHCTDSASAGVGLDVTCY